jgi:receptor expression-enhancing protein 5/6
LIYWTVFGLFTVVEGFIDNVLSWVPLYPIARVGFQVWLFAHNFAGAATVYGLAVVPIMSKVDGLVASISEEITVKGDKQSSK